MKGKTFPIEKLSNRHLTLSLARDYIELKVQAVEQRLVQNFFVLRLLWLGAILIPKFHFIFILKREYYTVEMNIYCIFSR